MDTVPVTLADHPYEVLVGDGLLSEAQVPAAGLEALVGGRRCLVVSDSNVAPLYASATTTLLQQAGAAQLHQTVFPAGEPSKTLATLGELYGDAVAAGLDRQSVIVALGGGVVGDVAGFLAATYMRGIRLLQIPTSLLAQVDSAVGGKTGVDLSEGKNLVGAFHQPSLVLADIATLRTLPARQLRCGLAEVVKYGVILDAALFARLEASAPSLLRLDAELYLDVVRRSCELKAEIVVADQFEAGQRAILNYGHTFGHAIETLTNYEVYTHGEAVAIGMMMAADLACGLGKTPARVELVRRQEQLLQALGLPRRVADLAPQAILAAMQTDKKFVGGENRLIVPDRLGEVGICRGVDTTAIAEAIGGRCDA